MSGRCLRVFDIRILSDGETCREHWVLRKNESVDRLLMRPFGAFLPRERRHAYQWSVQTMAFILFYLTYLSFDLDSRKAHGIVFAHTRPHPLVQDLGSC